jgi:signal peptidase I
MNAAPRAARISAAVALLLAAAWLFWPINLGGGTIYVSTHGISMEPRFHTGDLGVLRASDHYAVGDVVAYNSPTLKTTVMHRIVALDGNRFVIQGDNNSWLDPDRPTQDLILGKLWFRVPQGGKALAALRSPWVVGLISIAGIGILGAARKPLQRRPSQGRPRHARVFSMSTRAFALSTRAVARQVTLASAAVATLAAAGGGILLAMPPTQNDATTVSVTQQGTYSYTGSAVPGTTYPTGRIVTGDPIYTTLTGDLTVSLKETVRGPGLSAVKGTLRLGISIAAPDGWSADVGRGAAVPLGTRATTASVVVQSDAAAQLLARHYAEVGGSGNDATLSITPHVDGTGTVSGKSFTPVALAPLSFTLTPTVLHMTGDATKVLTPVGTTPVSVQHVVPRHLTVLGHAIPLRLALLAAVVILAVSLIVLPVAGWIGRPRASADPADEFLMKNAARILPVTRFTPGNTVIDVSDGDALHRVAERLDTLVLHRAGPDDHVFAVQDVETTYRFVLPVARDDSTITMAPVAAGGPRSGRRPSVPVARNSRLRSVPFDDSTIRLRSLEDTARIARVHRRIPVPPPTRPLDGLA